MREPAVISVDGLGRLIEALVDDGFEIIGPRLDDGVIGYGNIGSLDDLPAGWTDDQAPGMYRVGRRDDSSLFGYVVGPHTWKRYLHPPEAVIWAGRRSEGGFESIPLAAPPRYAFLGVRPCEVAAMAVQDRVFGDNETPNRFVDRTYQERRSGAFIVAVNCIEPGETCFCTSTDTGPRVRDGFDLALTEVVGPSTHSFLVEVGSERGAEMLGRIGQSRPAARDEIEDVDDLMAASAAAMDRVLDTSDLRELLYANLENPEWAHVAARCLSCTNCTLVCPTCFCTTVDDGLSLDGDEAVRTRRWDSCFTLDFSYIHGGSMRREPSARYRQWMTHKLASWIDQFGVLGCVGCGRCITWCPVGIDITEEVSNIRATDHRTAIQPAFPTTGGRR